MRRKLVCCKMIVEMTQNHVSQIAELEARCFSDPWSARSIASELENPLSLWLVEEREGCVAGYIGSQSVPPEADVMNVAVAPEFRRCGVASALLSALLARLCAQGIESLSLEVRVSNAPARALYERFGFAAVGLRKNYYLDPKEDALILRKELSDADSGN